MKVLVVAVVFILGVSLGYFLGLQNQGATETAENIQVADNSNPKNTAISDHQNSESELIGDTDEVETNDQLQDSLAGLTLDSTFDGDQIATEKLMKSTYMPIVYLGDDLASGDTSMQNLLGIEEVKNTELFVEFWESPLNFEGYKLSRKKLVVYGLSPQFEYKIFKDGEDYFFSYQNIYFKMQETQDFLPLAQVSKNEVFND